MFSDPDSEDVKKEQMSYVFFRDLLEEVESKIPLSSECFLCFFIYYNFVTVVVDGDTDLTMGDVLSYFTGADSIPPLGFDDATLSFNNTNPYPTASTCALCLTLPTMYQDYASFKEHFIFALCNMEVLDFTSPFTMLYRLPCSYNYSSVIARNIL